MGAGGGGGRRGRAAAGFGAGAGLLVLAALLGCLGGAPAARLVEGGLAEKVGSEEGSGGVSARAGVGLQARAGRPRGAFRRAILGSREDGSGKAASELNSVTTTYRNAQVERFSAPTPLPPAEGDDVAASALVPVTKISRDAPEVERFAAPVPPPPKGDTVSCSKMRQRRCRTSLHCTWKRPKNGTPLWIARAGRGICRPAKTYCEARQTRRSCRGNRDGSIECEWQPQSRLCLSSDTKAEAADFGTCGGSCRDYRDCLGPAPAFVASNCSVCRRGKCRGS